MLASWPSVRAGIADHLQTIRSLNHGESLTAANCDHLRGKEAYLR